MGPRELVEVWVDAFNKRDVDKLAAFYSETATNYQVPESPVYAREALRTIFRNACALTEMVCIPDEPAPAGIRPRIVRRRGVAGTLLTLLLACLYIGSSVEAGRAEGYPERTIKIVVPFPAGGPTDVAARLVAQSLSPRLGHNVIVENQSGAGGRIGAKTVATAAPDGYTLLLGGTNVNAISGAIYKNLGFEPVGSFAPVAMIYTDSLALALSPRVPADTCQQLINYARDNPGKLKFGAPPGIYTHFAGEFFKIKTGTDILFVPYKGGAPAVTKERSSTEGVSLPCLTEALDSDILPSKYDGKTKEAPELLPSTLDLLILQALAAGSLHGYGIANRLRTISEDVLHLNQGTLYPALLRLEQQGWIASEWGTSENNRRARYYSLTRSGRKQLAAETESWERMSAIMTRLLEGA